MSLISFALYFIQFSFVGVVGELSLEFPFLFLFRSFLESKLQLKFNGLLERNSRSVSYQKIKYYKPVSPPHLKQP